MRSYAPQDHSGREGPIPADAGEPCSARTKSRGSRAYPRGRGGARDVSGHQGGLQGLSPRTRGSPAGAARAAGRRGPIPADAGEPLRAPSTPPAAGAYPRGRGGARMTGMPSVRRWGLSPRTRGSRPRLSGRAHLRGPIPADAGEPDEEHQASSPTRAYPRGRRGAVRRTRRSRPTAGLSPRTRGSPGRDPRAGSGEGPIPADAGEPAGNTHSRAIHRAYPRGRGGAFDTYFMR